MAWIKPESIGTNMRMLTKAKASQAANRRDLRVNTAGNIVWIVGGLTTNTSVTSSNTVSAGSWSLVVAIYDSTNTELAVYVDNTKTSVTASGSANDSNTDFAIGCSFFGGSDAADSFFDGIIDDAAVFDRALTADEVDGLFTNFLTRRPLLFM